MGQSVADHDYAAAEDAYAAAIRKADQGSAECIKGKSRSSALRYCCGRGLHPRPPTGNPAGERLDRGGGGLRRAVGGV